MIVLTYVALLLYSYIQCIAMIHTYAYACSEYVTKWCTVYVCSTYRIGQFTN